MRDEDLSRETNPSLEGRFGPKLFASQRRSSGIKLASIDSPRFTFHEY
jgi:hypothetical protein